MAENKESARDLGLRAPEDSPHDGPSTRITASPRGASSRLAAPRIGEVWPLYPALLKRSRKATFAEVGSMPDNNRREK